MSDQIFKQVSMNRPPKNTFDLTHDKKLSTKMGKLTPIFLMDVVPGDKVSVKANMMVRFAPMIAPIMHKVSVYCHFFFVPNRILWENFEDFITGGEDGQDASVWPYIEFSSANILKGNVADYLGLPVDTDTTQPTTFDVSALPFSAFQKIWYDYYRDQNLQTEAIDPTNAWHPLQDGQNAQAPLNLTNTRRRSWGHSYFTSALPWTQKGPEALLPLGTTAPIKAYDDQTPPPQGFPLYQYFKDSTDGASTLNLGQTIKGRTRPNR